MVEEVAPLAEMGRAGVAADEELPVAGGIGLVRELVRQVFGSGTELAAWRIANRRPDYVVLLARLARPDLEVAIKLAGPAAPYVYPFDRTAAVHRLVAARTSIPMPEILAVDAGYGHWPWRYLIKTVIPGEEWCAVRPRLAAAERRAAYAHIGRAVAEMHAIEFPVLGELRSDGTPDAGAAGPADLVAALAARARRILAPHLAGLFIEALQERAGLFRGALRPGLCHEDLHHHNILFEQRAGQWRLATILDFDKAWAGPPETDLARLELWTGMTGPGFWPAYRAVRPVDDGYAARRPLYQLLWCLEYALDTPRHLADTARVCAELSLAPLQSFGEVISPNV